jgi:hypothetical protein
VSNEIGWLSGTCGTGNAFLAADDLTPLDTGPQVPAAAVQGSRRVTVLLGRHQPQRTSWDCACTTAWPCPVARIGLRLGLTDPALGELMAEFLQLAAHDLSAERHVEPGYLFERFLAWARH